MAAAPYPRSKPPNKISGRRRQEIDLDHWLEAGNLRWAWVFGTMWIQAMAASDEFYRRWLQLTRENPNQIASTDQQQAAETLIARADSGGMVVVNSEVYLSEPISSELSDIVLPASGWGEHDYARANGERRLRLYSKFYDAPGDAKPDWWAIAQFARRMGFEGYDWQESNDGFEEAARFSRGGILNYHPLVVKAKEEGKKGPREAA
jgi:arsenite oxidase large subunit